MEIIQNVLIIIGIFIPRSSISKYNLILTNSVGTIDSGYRGNILARFKYIAQPEDYVPIHGLKIMINYDKIYKIGDRIAQLIAFGQNKTTLRYKDELSMTERNDGGFGHTGN